jgi:prepilin-type N-terminal cleavage/methylation domain-containing protein
MFRNRQERGFTLIELLVVIAILGVLIALLLPAIHASKETARRMECQNHLKQLSLGCLSHEASLHYFPTGGWAPNLVGDPDLGFGKNQCGSWGFNILPFIEMKGIYNMGKGLKGDTKNPAVYPMVATPISVFNCPTRRSPIDYPWRVKITIAKQVAGKSDYAINSGDSICKVEAYPVILPYPGPSPYDWVSLSSVNGISFQRSMITAKEIINGMSRTYLVGEKYMNPTNYCTGAPGDDDSLYAGFDDDNFRTALNPPMRDRQGFELDGGFGSAHSTVWNMSFCDGSVRGISYDIDPLLHKCQSNRRNKIAF